MSSRARVGVLGLVGMLPYAGMAWMHCQYLVGLARLGCDVFYVESSSNWPYDPKQGTYVDDPGYTLGYLARVMSSFGFGDRWAYRPVYSDGQWRGPLASHADDLLRSADAVLNITGSTAPEELPVPARLVYIGTDPVIQEVRIANGDQELRERVAAHVAHFTYGETIGTDESPVPPLPHPTTPMRQPTVVDLWHTDEVPRSVFSTVMNWDTDKHQVEFAGTTYAWSKSHVYLRMLDLPTHRPETHFELAMGLEGLSEDTKSLLQSHGWALTDAFDMSLDPWPYRDYIRASAAEVSVAKDMLVKLRSGWFSERSAGYLAAGRPVIAHETGFSRVIPTGDGLFAFSSVDEVLVAVDTINSDYERQSKAAHEIAMEYFDAERVLEGVLQKLGL